MPRTFAYLRVSTTGQTTDNQLQEIAAAGFKVEPRRVVTETVRATPQRHSGAGSLGSSGAPGRGSGDRRKTIIFSCAISRMV